TRSVEISYADEAFEEESSVFVHDDTFASTDDAAVATAKSQLEGFLLHARSQNAKLQDPLRGQQGAPSTTPAAPLGFEPAWNEGSRDGRSGFVSAAAVACQVNELLDEAFKEQLSLLRSAASQQRDALHALLPSGMHPRSFVP
ncbi:hypothetical protein FOZ63_028598, partial [Perkinsus olseni]